MIGAHVGNYIIEAELGTGGMGAVYRARHTTLGRLAAVKVLLPQFSATPEIVQRFFNEAKAATSIRHLGIVEIYDFGQMSNGVVFIVMELLRGESLATRMRRQRMTPPIYLSTLRQMCGALGAAHDVGIVHRDLKPDNVFIVPDGEVDSGERVKLLDFGIAKLSEDSTGISTQTRTGAIMGTPAYMAPEQCRGIKVDHRADIYSLGCILFEMVTGRAPFRGEGFGDILAAHIYAKHESIEMIAPDTPTGVARLIDRLLAKAPEERPQTARELIAAIDVVNATVMSAGAAVAWEVSNDDAPVARPGPVLRARRRMIRVAGAVVSTGIAIAIIETTGASEIGSGAKDTDVHSILEPSNVTVASASPAIATLADAAVAMAPPTADFVDVRIDSTPGKARIWLDGKNIGTTPYHGKLLQSEATLKLVVRLPGFEDFRRDVHPRGDIVESAKLTPARGAHTPTMPLVRAGNASEPPPASNAALPAHKQLSDDDTLPPSHGHGSAQ